MGRTFPENVLLAQRFLIGRRVASGGMGTVLQASDQQTGKKVAIKVLLRGTDLRRFHREAAVLSRLNHPRIVAYVTHGVADGKWPYLAMEWLDGEDLATRLRRQRLSIPEALRLLRWCAEALLLPHQQGIVHRDIKPSNLFLRDGAVDGLTLIDFGIARDSRAYSLDALRTAMTGTGQMIGTPHFMSPEQARSTRVLTPASDLYSLGCVLFQVLTGKPPFSGPSVAAVLGQLLCAPAPRLLTVRRDLGEAFRPLDNLLAALLRKDAETRIPDARALLSALDGLPDYAQKAAWDTTCPGTPPPSGERTSDPALACIVVVLPRTSQAASDWADSSTGERPGAAQAGHDTATNTNERPRTERLFLSADEWDDELDDVSDDELDDTADLTSGANKVAQQQSTLRTLLASYGAHLDCLAGGALVVTVNPVHHGSAQDQAIAAARCALMLQERYAQAVVGLASGRSHTRDALPQGEAFERSMAMCQDLHTRAATAQPPTGIAIDDLSAALLPQRFCVQTQDGIKLLQEERSHIDHEHRLLGRPTPCVGRERELAILDSALQASIDASAARAVLVTAAAGVGKSRLRYEFLRRLDGKPFAYQVFLGRAEPLSRSTSHALLASALTSSRDLSPTASSAEKRAWLTHRVALVLDAGQAAQVSQRLCSLCRLDNGQEVAGVAVARCDPAIHNAELRQAFMDYLRAECQRQPVVLVFEDLQWADALTINTIDATLRDLADLPLLVVAFARPEVANLYGKLWQGRSLLDLRLAGLSTKAGDALIRTVLGPRVDPLVRDRIVVQAAGNALFLEELIRAAANEPNGTESTNAALPQTVLAMLQARLGRLHAHARLLLRSASVFGESFPKGGLLATINDELSEPDVDLLLAELCQQEILALRKDSLSADAEVYVFHHALVRDAAYGLLLEPDCVRYHALVGEYLEAHAPTDARVIAEHLLNGKQEGRAIPWLLRAAQQALDANDLDGAIALAERAVSAGARDAKLGAARAVQAHASYWKNQHADCLRYARAAIDLLTVGSAPWFALLGSSLVACARLGDLPTWRTLRDLCQTTAAEPAAQDEQIICLARCGSQMVQLTESSGVGDLIDRLTVLYQQHPRPDPIAQAQYHNLLADRLGLQGDIAGHTVHMERVVSAFAEANDLRNAALQRAAAAYGLSIVGDAATAERQLRANLAECEQRSFTQAAMFSRLLLGRVLGENHVQLGEARRLLNDVHAYHASLGYRRGQGMAQVSLARLSFVEGHIEQALELATSAHEHMAAGSLFFNQASSTKARALLGLREAKDALPLARMAFQHATQYGGYIMADLQCVLALVEALRGVNQHDEARTVLAGALRFLRQHHVALPRPEWRSCYLQRPERVELLRLAEALSLLSPVVDSAGGRLELPS